MTLAISTTHPRRALDRALESVPLSREEALLLYGSAEISLEELAEAARELRRAGKGDIVTYSPKIFLPLTNLCRDRCRYCTFRRDPGEAGAHWMEPEEVLAIARNGEALGCKEALLSLGDRPEAAFPQAKAWLREHGFERTLDYVAAIGELLARETALFPHSNPGLMARADLLRLKQSNVSLGLMLESTSLALFSPGGAHQDAVDKWPDRRLRTLREAGELQIPFTTGILVGIGEKHEDVIDSLLAIRDLQQRYGHIQEVIVQNFVPKPEIPMRDWPAPSPQAFARTVAIARLVLGRHMNIQAPPNLSPHGLELLLDCGINDWGGISPLTLDFINPESPWPEVEKLAALVAKKGLRLRQRLAVYPEYAARPEFFPPEVWKLIQKRTGSDWARKGQIIMAIKRNVHLNLKEAEYEDLAPQLAPPLRGALDAALEGKDLDREQGVLVAQARGQDLAAVAAVADRLRREKVGEEVSYVVNRNINFTNICTVGCTFCCFGKGAHSHDAYWHSLDTLADKAEEAWRLGATEVCMQGGLPPDLDGYYYRQILEAVKQRVPSIHIHAFSPMEVVYGVERSGLPLREFLKMLKDAGLGSLPGTAAEILDDRVRAIISRIKLKRAQWIEVITTAHELGIPTTSTIMYGHIEETEDWVNHILLLRSIQQRTGGFTEFVPLGFIHEKTTLFRMGHSRPGSSVEEDIAIHALARILLNNWIPNIQLAWPKLGWEVARLCLQAGVNDCGGTLMDEQITSASGEIAGTSATPEELQAFILSEGRIPVERSTTYKVLRRFEAVVA